jgi:hypothetical protein
VPPRIAIALLVTALVAACQGAGNEPRGDGDTGNGTGADIDSDADSDSDSDTDSDADSDADSDSSTASDTGSQAGTDSSTEADATCPFDSGYPCSCNGYGPLCADGSTCMNYGSGQGICAFGCTEETAEICTATDGWGFQGWCIFGIAPEPQFCGVECYFAETLPCPPGQWCAPIDSWVGICLPEGWDI